jgi:putative acetyltransferase
MALRPEQPSDHDAVHSVHRRAFGADHGPAVAELTAALRRHDPDGLSLVAEVDGAVVGNVMVTHCLLDAPARLVPVPVLSPLGIAPGHQKQGIGTALVRQALQELDDRGAPMVFLEGDPGYYSRLGFTPAGQSGFRKPSLRIPDGAFQVVKLAAYEPWMTGTLVYSSPFWDHDCVGLRDEDDA